MTLKRSSGDSGGEYQSVMMTPPNGSAEASGMKARVSSEARQRKELTPIPTPPPWSVFLPPRMLSPSSPKSEPFWAAIASGSTFGLRYESGEVST